MTEQVFSYSPAGPVIARFHQSRAYVRGIRGPVGSGKTTACCIELLRRAQEQEPGPDGIRRTRWAIIRNTALTVRWPRASIAPTTSTSTLYHVLIPYIAGAKSSNTAIIHLGRLSIFHLSW